jgi:hypothetical protein
MRTGQRRWISYAATYELVKFSRRSARRSPPQAAVVAEAGLLVLFPPTGSIRPSWNAARPPRADHDSVRLEMVKSIGSTGDHSSGRTNFTLVSVNPDPLAIVVALAVPEPGIDTP